jgi:hypothetical protein
MTEFEDTIVAISTPPGRGGIGIIRLSGPAARAIAEPLLKLRRPLTPAQARFAEILDSTGETLDEAVVTFFEKPHSYTSEDVVEIAAHGSPVLSTTSFANALPPAPASPNPANSPSEPSSPAASISHKQKQLTTSSKPLPSTRPASPPSN